MPIRPENRARYPKDWPDISRAARERARWRCQHPDCTARQYAVGHWAKNAAGLWRWIPTHGSGPHDAAGWGQRWPCGTSWTYSEAAEFARDCNELDSGHPKLIVIVLTVAHLNHQPEDCRPENLAAMCQRHHLAYDAPHHKQTAYATRRARTPSLELF